MTEITPPSGKQTQKSKAPFDKHHPFHPDYTGDNPRGFLNSEAALTSQTTPLPGSEQHGAPQKHTPEKEAHQHDHNAVSAEQSQRAEQELKQQQSEQNDRSAFPKGNAQAHQQGNRQK